jgi:RNA polymerase sigma-70 factor (ECF subfamily)
MEWTDAAAVAAVRAGNREAFRSLVDRHSRSIFRLAFRMTANEQDAEEVVQETFLRAYRRLDKFEERAEFSTWVYRIATNCALDLLDRRKHAKQEDPLYDEEDDRELQLPSSAPSPERQVLSSEMRQRVAAAMNELTGAERTAFVLRHIEGQSIEEISKSLAIKEGAAKNTIFRAVQKLRRALEPAMRPVR